MNATLSGKNLVDREELKAMPAPEARGPKHHPVAHLTIVEAIEQAARDRGLEIEREQFALQRGGDMIFGVFDFQALGAGPDLAVKDRDGGFSLGFRGSNDRQMSTQMVAGRRVFVCDNLCFSGDMFAMRRKHTSGFEVAEEIAEGLDRYLVHCGRLSQEIARLRSNLLHDDDAKRIIFDAFHHRVLPVTHFPRVSAAYFAPTDEMTDCLPRNRWGLHNAFTRSIRTMRPETGFTATTRLGQFFGIGTAN